MKSLRKLNPFRGKATAPPVKDDNKENSDDSRRVHFAYNSPPKRPTKRQNPRSVFADDTYINNPAGAYHCPTAPRTRRPLRSCPGGMMSPSAPASSSDDETLVDPRTQNRRRERPSGQQNHLRHLKTSAPIAVQTSSEYGSGDPSPVSDVLRHYNNESRFPTEPMRGNGMPNFVKYSKYEKYKMRYHTAVSNNAHTENMLKRAYADNTKLAEENTSLKVENENLRARIAQLEGDAAHNRRMMSLAAPQPRNCMPNGGFVPAFPTFFNQQMPPLPLNSHGISGAGEHLASQITLPSSSASTAPISHSYGDNDEDETKNFRNTYGESVNDSVGGLSVDASSVSVSSVEQARRMESLIESPEQIIGLTRIIDDDGYQSNQTLKSETVVIEDQTTPVKPASGIRRGMKARKGALPDTL